MAYFKDLCIENEETNNENNENNNGKAEDNEYPVCYHLKFWTPVTMALPPLNNVVLTCTDHGVCDFLRFEHGDIHNVKGQVWKDDDTNLTIHGVVCWATLPNPFDPENISHY